MLTMNGYLDSLKKEHPEELLIIEEEINPAEFEATAILQHLENAGFLPDVPRQRKTDTPGGRN